MPAFDFDNEYGGDDEADPPTQAPASSAAVADRLVANLSESPQDESLDEDYMGEVDKRLEVTTYYRELLRSSLFGVDTEASRIVEREIRHFVRDRVEILLGIRTESTPRIPPVVLPFSEVEVDALKYLAGRLLANPSIAKPDTEKKPEPAVRLVPPPVVKSPAIVSRRVPRAASPPATTPSAPAPADKPKRGPKPTSIKKTLVSPETGAAVEITKERIQRPAGALPFPSAQEMEVLTAQQASHAVSAAAQGRTGTVELVTAALRQPEQS